MSDPRATADPRAMADPCAMAGQAERHDLRGRCHE
ncbi:MAG: hypothetical protein JWN00_3499 [Actinomycetia bacterium]|nr:hypothetical protein [Actinomycetes bacterium]